MHDLFLPKDPNTTLNGKSQDRSVQSALMAGTI
jgi:hypothetical protein